MCDANISEDIFLCIFPDFDSFSWIFPNFFIEKCSHDFSLISKWVVSLFLSAKSNLLQ